ncbi:MAG: polysaccharide biosynthesis/export family protein [Gammaproteobacteria bacterium]
MARLTTIPPVLALVIFLLGTPGATADEAVGEPAAPSSGYHIQPGDALRISVWKEADLQQDLLVRPDGGFSFPLAGDLAAAGHTVGEIQAELASRIEEYIPDPVVTVQVLQTEGNTIYVLGKVQRPGAYVMNRPLDVTQALALAGGLAVFAEENSISILRRTDGAQTVLQYRYGDVQYGRDLDQNVVLHAGDVVVVP